MKGVGDERDPVELLEFNYTAGKWHLDLDYLHWNASCPSRTISAVPSEI